MLSNSLKKIIFLVLLLICGIVALLTFKLINKEEKQNNDEFIEIKEKYEYNEFKFLTVTDKLLIQRYFVNFKDKLLTSPEDAYKLVDNETKEKYPNYVDFKEYINLKYDEIYLSKVEKYSIKTKGNKNIYVILDQFNNMYTFDTTAILIYKVNIDLYNENSSIFD